MKNVLRNVRQYKLFRPDERLIIAVSGGADSLALLHWAWTHHDHIIAATFDHNLRDAAATDADFVRSLCAAWGVPCVVGQMTAPYTGNIEDTARLARYRFLARVAHHAGARTVVTAHHADDQAETILLHILRGAGLRGAGGMASAAPLPTDARLRLVRPLLDVPREAIIAYCEAHDLRPRHDPTNDDTDLTRNYIRHRALPVLREVNPRVVDALNRFGRVARRDDDLLTALTNEAWTACVIASTADYAALSRRAVAAHHPAIQYRLLSRALAGLLPAPAVTEARLSAAVDALNVAAVGSRIEMGEGVSLYMDYDALIAGDYHAYLTHGLLHIRPEQTITLSPPDDLMLGEGWRLRSSWTPLDDADARLNVAGVRDIALRTRRAGDRLQPLGMGGRSQKLKAWMIDRKIPRIVRDSVPLLVCDGVIAAVLYGAEWLIDHRFRVTGAPDERVLYLSASRHTGEQSADKAP